MFTVLHYTGYTSPGGGIDSVIRALGEEKKFNVVRGVSKAGDGDNRANAETWFGPWIDGEQISPVNFWRARSVAVGVRQWLWAEPGRVFHGHSRAGLLVGIWLHWMGEPRVVVSVHCYGRQRWFYRWAAGKLGNRLFWLTPEMKRYYDIPGTDWAQCVPGGVPAACFQVTPATPIPGRIRLGAAGMMVRWKRWEIILQAMALLPANIRPGVTFEHIGAASSGADSLAYAQELYAMTKKLGLTNQVKWCGGESSSRRLLANIDLLVVSSRNEPYSMIIQEALAGGIPVIAAASGGPLDIVRPGVNGWFFKEGDAQSLADVLADQWQSKEWMNHDCSGIQRTARKAETAAAEWHSIYDQLPGVDTGNADL